MQPSPTLTVTDSLQVEAARREAMPRMEVTVKQVTGEDAGITVKAYEDIYESVQKGLALGRDFTVSTVWYANDKVKRGTKWEDENIEDGAVVTAAVDMTAEGRRKAAERAILMELYDQCGYVHVTPPCVPPF